ncbi:hypothetical protein EK21DRAFT_93857 [Setomelanomma holmii]|uniref:Uncharacterized protein n=1 Tax=Setomelanomma holmii TaxID=210430 RepID=A0A9P4LH05_9PLEO|nr:hypothetical protein EK21DRAFT_93857 [Setomelanomma holmii]
MSKVRQQQEQLRYDRRAERRKIDAQFEVRINNMREELERKAVEDREAMLQQMNFDQAIALVRANEDKISVSERDALEHKIAELSKKLAEESTSGGTMVRKKKGGIQYLVDALKLILPVTTMALLGVPIFLPFGEGADGDLAQKIFGDDGQDSAA